MSVENQAGSAPLPAKEPKIIKRYSNRKLYDTDESRYVTLDEIGEMVKNGAEVKIIDNRNKEDLTSVTLAQIIFEEEKKTSRMPLTVLREIIRNPGESISGFIEKELSPRVASIREEAETRLDKLLRRDDGRKDGTQEESVTDKVKASQTFVEDWQRRIDERVRHVIENFSGSLPALGRDVQALAQRLERLEKRIEELEKRTPPSSGQ